MGVFSDDDLLDQECIDLAEQFTTAYERWEEDKTEENLRLFNETAHTFAEKRRQAKGNVAAHVVAGDALNTGDN